MREEIKPGAYFERPWPFYKTPTILGGETWKLGARRDELEGDLVADADGTAIYKVVSIHKPGPKFQTRVFFTKEFKDPERVSCGREKLCCETIGRFKKRLSNCLIVYELT